MAKLFNFYSFDECLNEEQLFEKLDALASESKLAYSSKDDYIIKIKDLDLGDSEIVDLTDFFDSLNVYPYLNETESDEDEEEDFSEFDSDFDDDSAYSGRYKSKRKSSDDEDDYFDDF